MSVDARVSKDLVETLRDGQEGFAKAAEKLADSDAPEIGATFRGYSEQRRQFADELEKLAQSYGDDVDESGSAVGALHRGWISVKDAVTGSSPEAVLKAAESGESHAVTEYKKALDAASPLVCVTWWPGSTAMSSRVTTQCGPWRTHTPERPMRWRTSPGPSSTDR